MDSDNPNCRCGNKLCICPERVYDMYTRGHCGPEDVCEFKPGSVTKSEEHNKLVNELTQTIFDPKKIEKEMLDEATSMPFAEFEHKFSEMTTPKVSPQTERGTKYNTGKPRMHLIPGRWQKALAQVAGFGADKYGDWNWVKGIPVTELIDATERHIADFKDGIDFDSESKLEHVLHAAMNLMMIYEMMRDKPEMDDRRKK